ncbi:heavy-metal-associated domain-containing protein [Pseudarthrobacter sp. NPDC058362]|uniref:heavy-metal-associated domain-containing protein n=1 Tax=Pseudarthrobacter sp. NPDC058362 TaxID=3346458 RepID=UPI00364AF178
MTWYVPAGAPRRLSQPFNPSSHHSLDGMETDMCGTEIRTTLPLASAGGCSCCGPAEGATKADAGAQARPAVVPSPASGAPREFALEGLTCGHCAQTVEKALGALAGVDAAKVELVPRGRSRLTVTGSAADADLRQAVAAAGYAAL